MLNYGEALKYTKRNKWKIFIRYSKSNRYFESKFKSLGARRCLT